MKPSLLISINSNQSYQQNNRVTPSLPSLFEEVHQKVQNQSGARLPKDYTQNIFHIPQLGVGYAYHTILWSTEKLEFNFQRIVFG